MSEPPRIVRLDEEKIPEAAALLARAFHEDPLWLYVVPDPAERARATLEVFIRYLRFGHLYGDVYGTEGQLEGVSVWLSPERQQRPARQGQQSGWGELPSILGPDAFGRLATVLRYEREIHDRDLPEPHWYLMQLGVDPPEPQGIAQRLGEGLGAAQVVEEPLMSFHQDIERGV